MKPISIIIAGVKGRMGQALVASLQENDSASNLLLAGGIESETHPEIGHPIVGKGPILEKNIKKAAKGLEQGVVIDFTTPAATLSHLEECLELKIPMVIGTTGFKTEEMEKIKKASQKIPVVMAANFSIGVNLMTKIIEELARNLPESYDLEIVEAHHRLKKDAPSGTALRLAQALAQGRDVNLKDVLCLTREGETGVRPQGQIGVQTVRAGEIIGDHTVIFAGPGEQLEVTHRAHSRKNFAQGALRAAKWLWETGKAREAKLYDMLDVLA